MNILKNKKVVSTGLAVGVMTIMSISAFAAGEGTLPTEVNTMFTTLATGLIATIGAIAVIALGVYAAPQAITFAKKIFKKISA
ncbi:MAG: hypothetical protein N3I35_04765 [Clostridia bacterium]|nr:hypothetical protein [Clostridia bacterium]